MWSGIRCGNNQPIVRACMAWQWQVRAVNGRRRDAIHGCWLVGCEFVLSGDLRFSGEAGGPSVHGIDLVVGRGCANLVFTQEIVVWSRTHASFLVWNQ
jgi:hypothetical protein